MNAIGKNRARDGWQQLGKKLPKPRVIIAVSAHWQTSGICVRTAPDNPQIYDMYGFPDELYRVHYEPAGSPADAKKALALLGASAREDNTWGIDHGVWSVLSNIFPAADVPVVMVSVDGQAGAGELYEAGRKLAALRDDGAMIFASGNVVHNLRLVDWNMTDGYGWAKAFDSTIRDAVLTGDHGRVLHFDGLENSSLAVPTSEHFLPLPAALGAVTEKDRPSVFNEYCELGSMSMTSYLFC
jgi:4,5-DOPA dioxygenase extradiol